MVFLFIYMLVTLHIGLCNLGGTYNALAISETGQHVSCHCIAAVVVFVVIVVTVIIVVVWYLPSLQ